MYLIGGYFIHDIFSINTNIKAYVAIIYKNLATGANALTRMHVIGESSGGLTANNKDDNVIILHMITSIGEQSVFIYWSDSHGLLMTNLDGKFDLKTTSYLCLENITSCEI